MSDTSDPHYLPLDILQNAYKSAYPPRGVSLGDLGRAMVPDSGFTPVPGMIQLAQIPHQALYSTEPISTEEMVKPGMDLASIVAPSARAPTTVGFLEDLKGILARGAGPEEIAGHPVLRAGRRLNEGRPLSTDLPGYGTPEFQANRQFDIPGGKPSVGYDAASDHLTDVAKGFSTNGPVQNQREATIVLGPPAAGKSSMSERFARQRNAAIVDSDEAKKIIPGYDNGLGSTAVHQESSDLTFDHPNGVFRRLVREGANMVIPKVGQNPESIDILMNELKNVGYKTNLVNMNVSPENAYRRMINRFLDTGRLINANYFKNVGDKPTRTYYALKGKAHEATDIDANGPIGSERFLDGPETSLAGNIRSR